MPRYERVETFECRHCGCKQSIVTNTWSFDVTYYGKTKTLIKRRRVCRYCGLPYTTIETIEDDDNPGNPELITPPPIPPHKPQPKPSDNLAAAPLLSPPLLPPKKPRRGGRPRNPYLE